MEPVAPQKATWRQWAGLAVVTLPLLMASTDMTVLFLALPSIAADLNPGSTQMLWVLHIAEFLGVGMALTMGWLGARVGRRRLLMLGVAVYGTASLGAAFAVNVEMLLAMRALMGMAAASLAPSITALLRVMFRDSQQFSVAVAVMMSSFSAGMALGPPLGGVILEYFTWGAVFLVNVPIAALLVLVAPVLLPGHRSEGAGRFDLTSVLLSTTAIITVIFGLQEIADQQASAHGAPLWPYIGSVLTGLVLGVVFVRRQLRLPEPLLDMRLFATPAFSVSMGAMLFMLLAIGGADMLLTQYLQTVLGLSPAHAGLLLIIPAVAGLITGLLPPLLNRWVRPGGTMGGGLLFAAAGAAAMVWAVQAGQPVGIIVSATVVAAALGPLFTLSLNLAVASAPVSKAGSAAAVADVSGGLGYALSVAFLGSLSSVVYRWGLNGADLAGVPQEAREAAGESIGGATGIAEQLPSGAGAELVAAANSAFADAVQTGYGVGALLLPVMGVAVLWLLRHVRLEDEPAGQEQQGPGKDSSGATGPDAAGAGTAESGTAVLLGEGDTGRS